MNSFHHPSPSYNAKSNLYVTNVMANVLIIYDIFYILTVYDVEEELCLITNYVNT